MDLAMHSGGRRRPPMPTPHLAGVNRHIRYPWNIAKDTDMIDLAAVDHFLLFFVSTLSLYLTYSRTLHASGICGAILLALGIVLTNAHYTIAEMLFPAGTNPQYITVGYCVFAAVCISARAVIGPRSIDRILVGAAMVSVVATAALFHYVLVANVLPSWARDGAWGNGSLLELDADEFQSQCASAGLSCFTGPQLDPEQLRPDLRSRIASIIEHFQEASPDEEAAHAFGHFNDLGDLGVAAVLVYNAPGKVRVIVDEKAGKRIHSTVRDSFYLLSSTAHIVWTAGALGLIVFHRRRFRARAKHES